LARALMVKLLEVDDREVTLLDGDLVRKHLSSELGFSKEHRDINIRRIGYVASEITKHRGVALCAPIAPYRETRRVIRQMIEPLGGFFEIYISTPLEECERRDHKGLYARARAGLVKEFTGISDPYESPERAELSLDTSKRSVEQCMQIILQKIKDEGYLM
jgi:sulfate adenylyltransferase